MSILIKGMRMPENCLKCPMQFGGMCYVMPDDVDESRVAPTVEDAWKQRKPDWCPLVEIPEPHGRLIDADALKETLDYYICEANWGDEVNKALRWVKDEFINSENTVIEAEGSEDHDD